MSTPMVIDPDATRDTRGLSDGHGAQALKPRPGDLNRRFARPTYAISTADFTSRKLTSLYNLLHGRSTSSAESVT
jgi:hypothetical protein